MFSFTFVIVEFEKLQGRREERGEGINNIPHPHPKDREREVLLW